MAREGINTASVPKSNEGTNRLANKSTDVREELGQYIQEGDIVVATFMRSGTTWMTQLILQMINNGEETLFAPDYTIHYAVPWIENRLRVQPKDKGVLQSLEAPLDGRRRRRILKSHMQPEEAIPFFGPKVKYVCVFRDGRDVVLSLYNHGKSLTEEFLKRATRKNPEESHPIRPVCTARARTTTSEIGTSTSFPDVGIEGLDPATDKNDTPTKVPGFEREARNAKVLAIKKDVKFDVVVRCYDRIDENPTKECLQQTTHKGPDVGTHEFCSILKSEVDDTTIRESGTSTTILDIGTKTSSGATCKNDPTRTPPVDIETEVVDFMAVTKRDEVEIFNDFDTLYEAWLQGSNPPFWKSNYFHHLKSWFNYANTCDNNVLLINYSEMQFDLANVVSRLAKFLDISVDGKMSTSCLNILHHSSFDYMKRHEELFDPPSTIMKPGRFIHKGMSGRWRNVLTDLQQQTYWDKITQTWSPELIKFVHK